MHRSDVFSQIPLPHSCVITLWALLSFSPTVFLFHMGCDCRPPPWVQTFCFKKKVKTLSLGFVVAVLPRASAQLISMHCRVMITHLQRILKKPNSGYVVLPHFCWNPGSRIPNNYTREVSNQGGPSERVPSYQNCSLT